MDEVEILAERFTSVRAEPVEAGFLMCVIAPCERIQNIDWPFQ